MYICLKIVMTKMITAKDLYNILENKIANEAQKSLIRSNFPPQIAEKMCNAIDCQEKAEHFKRFLIEWNEWLANQQRQQQYIQAQGGLSVADGCRCLTKELDMIAC